MSSDSWDLSPAEHFRNLMGTGGGNFLIDSLSAVIGTRVLRCDHRG